MMHLLSHNIHVSFILKLSISLSIQMSAGIILPQFITNNLTTTQLYIILVGVLMQVKLEQKHVRLLCKDTINGTIYTSTYIYVNYQCSLVVYCHKLRKNAEYLHIYIILTA